MSRNKTAVLARLPCAFFLVIVVLAAWEAVFALFVLYHSQNRILRPDDYDIQVVTAAEFRSLADPDRTAVRLADGSVVSKKAAWDAAAFKPIAGGATYARVTTKGTAHLLGHTLPSLLVFLFLGIVGVVLSWPRSGKNQHVI